MRSICIVALAAIVAMTAFGCSKKGGKGGADSTSAQADSLKAAGKTVITVNGKAITEGEVTKQQAVLRQQLTGRVDPAQLATMGDAIKKQAAMNAVNRLLLEGAIAKLNIQASDAEIQSRFDLFRKNFVSDEEFNKHLAQSSMTADDVRKEIRTGIQAEELFKMRTAKMQGPTEAQLREFYDNNEARFKQTERMRASHILLGTSTDMTDQEKLEKRQQAEKILADVKKGSDFAALAKQYSTCPSKEQGGDLGYFERGKMVPEFEKAAYALKKGQVSGIVETQFGYHIIKCTDRQIARTVPFSEAKESISSYLAEQMKGQALTAYMDSLRNAATIVYQDSSYMQVQ